MISTADMKAQQSELSMLIVCSWLKAVYISKLSKGNGGQGFVPFSQLPDDPLCDILRPEREHHGNKPGTGLEALTVPAMQELP